MAGFTPREYQRRMIDYGLDHTRCNFYASPGVGKTSASLELFARLQLLGESKRALVLAPRRVAESVWPAEIEKWRESFGHLRIAAAVGTPAQRLAALALKPDILCTNYEQIDWLREVCGADWPFDTVFADESPRLKGLRVSMQRRKRKDGTWGDAFVAGQGASRAKSLALVAHSKVRRWINLTGSPATNGLLDLWGPQWFVDGGLRLGHTFSAYTDRWFRARPGSRPEHGLFEPMPGAKQEIERLQAETSIVIDAAEWFDIKKPIERHVMVDLSATARKQYDEMERDFSTEVGSAPVRAPSATAKMTKCLQIASGSVIPAAGAAAVSVHDEKLDALRSLVEETAGAPLLIRYEFVADKLRILAAFPRFRSLDHDSNRTIREFQDGKVAGLVVHAASAGHGLDLQRNCWTLIDYTSTHNLEHDEQIVERIGPTRQAQLGLKRAVFRYRIIARDTIEETVVLPVLARKASVQDALKAAIKARNRR